MVDEQTAWEAISQTGLQLSRPGFAELLARSDLAPEGFPPFSDFLICISRPPDTSEQHLPLAPTHEPTAGGMPTPAAPAAAQEPTTAFAREPTPTPPPAPAQEAPHAQAKSLHFSALPQPPEGTAALPPQAPGYSPPAAYDEAQMKEHTWRHMQTQKQLVQLEQFAPTSAPRMAPNHQSFQGVHVAASRAVANPQEQILRESVHNGTTARLGVATKQPTSSFPLGAKSHVRPLGFNGADPAKPSYARPQKFTNSFGPDPFF